MNRQSFNRIIIFAAALMLASCCVIRRPEEAPPPPPPPPVSQNQVDANVSVTVTRDNAGKYHFYYVGDYVDAEGNFDFSLGGALYHAVLIKFTIAPGSVPNIEFAPTEEKAMWIAEEASIGPKGSPSAPYRGDQFSGFATEVGGQRMHLIDANNDGKRYRYSLRFYVDGQPVAHDPDLSNGTWR